MNVQQVQTHERAKKEHKQELLLNGVWLDADFANYI